MPRTGSLRASDADREQVVQRLHTAATEGRLSPDELDGRVHAALTALTYADLDAVLADLPRPAAQRRDAVGRDAVHRDAPRRTPARRRTVGGWAVTTVRANPLLLIFMIPVIATAGAMLIAAAVTWMTLLAIVMLLGGGRHRHLIREHRGPWSLMWSTEDRL